jgi:hypothetical protein
MILKIDNYGHAANMPTIQISGKYAFRAINNPRAVPESKWEGPGVAGKELRKVRAS